MRLKKECERGKCVYKCVCHCTVPLLKSGPQHVDVGFLSQVNFTSSFEDSPGLLDAPWLQVLRVLNTLKKYILNHLCSYAPTFCKLSGGFVDHRQTKISPWSRTPHRERRRSGSAQRGCAPCGHPAQLQQSLISPHVALWPLTPRWLKEQTLPLTFLKNTV